MKLLAFIALVLALIYAATRWGDPRHPLAIEAAATDCPAPRPNHFATINRDVRRMT